MIQQPINRKGITLIELLVALVIAGIVIAGIYRLFITQTRAYTVQDQVAEVQQNARSAMEILLRDLRLAGCDDDNLNSPFTITNPVVYPVGANSVRVNYERSYFDAPTNSVVYENHDVTYWLNGQNLTRTWTFTDSKGFFQPPLQDIILQNVNINLIQDLFTYGVDGTEGLSETQDGMMDDQNGNGLIDNGDWVTAGNVGSRRVIAVRVDLEANPTLVNTDLQAVSPRRLTSAVTLRNQCLIR